MGASVVASGDSSPVFELGEQVLDLVPGFICCFAVFDCFFSVFLRWDARRDLLFGEHGSNFVAVISAIPDQGFSFRQVLKQNIRALEVAALPFRQMKPDWPPEVVTQGMQFRVQPAFGAPDQSWLFAPFLRLDAVR